MRLSHNRMLGGVCAGIAEYFGVEVNFVRLFYLLTSAASAVGPGVVIYLVLWLMLPPPE